MKKAGKRSVPIVLKKCPFCGSDRIRLNVGTFSFYIDCADCKATTGQFYTVKETVEHWNRREMQVEI